MSWSEQVDSNPALKRKLAFWIIGSIAAVFVVVFGAILVFGRDETPQDTAKHSEPAPACAEADPRYLQPGYRGADPMAASNRRLAEEDSARTWTVVLVLVVGFVSIVAFFWLSRRWSANHPQRQQRSDDPTNPVVAVFKGIGYLILFCSGPIGWILAYLWHEETRGNRERLAVAEALEELDQRQTAAEVARIVRYRQDEAARNRAMHDMAAKLDELEQERAERTEL